MQLVHLHLLSMVAYHTTPDLICLTKGALAKLVLLLILYVEVATAA